MNFYMIKYRTGKWKIHYSYYL